MYEQSVLVGELTVPIKLKSSIGLVFAHAAQNEKLIF